MTAHSKGVLNDRRFAISAGGTLFSLFSLNSLNSLLPGMIFNTREGGGTRGGGGISVSFVLKSFPFSALHFPFFCIFVEN